MWKLIVISFILVLIIIPNRVVRVTCDDSLDTKGFLVWGPGIETEARIALPVQYFYIQATKNATTNITESLPSRYDIQFVGRSSLGPCRVRAEQIDRGDGSVLVRYRATVTCWDLLIVVKWRDKHVAQSPYAVTGKLYPEMCHCPRPLDDYMTTARCPVAEDQVTKDLNAFQKLNYTKDRTLLLQQFTAEGASGSVAVCQYLVKAGSLYRQCFGEHVGFKMFMDAILLSLLRKVALPDLELFVNLGDWPLMKKGGRSRTTGPRPIFSWCGSDDSYDIVMPTYDLTESTVENMDRVTIDTLSVQKRRVPWPEKSDLAFWRGRDARRERLEVVALARAHPDLLNASLTHFFFFRGEEAEYGPKVPHMSFFRFFDYKYQVTIDGTVAAYRVPYLLAGDSLVLKQDSPYYEHFYKKLIPFEHYVPFKRDLSDLIEQIRWARDNEELVRRIIRNANVFANDHLMPANIYCYHMLLFKEWSRLQAASTIDILPGMERVEQPEQSQNCQCDRTGSNAHEEL